MPGTPEPAAPTTASDGGGVALTAAGGTATAASGLTLEAGAPSRPGSMAGPAQPPGAKIGATLAGSPAAQLSYVRRFAVRYGLAVGFVAAGVAAALVVEALTGRFTAFPFFAAIVASAWFGSGPGFLSLVLSSLAVVDIWTPPLLSLEIEPAEVPAFIGFVVCAMTSFAWSWQRRRAQYTLEATVRQRTADLLRANSALQLEIIEREAAEKERNSIQLALRDAEAGLARALRLATVAEIAATIAHEINQPLAAITANGGACLRSLAHQPPMLDTAREAAACIVADGHRAGDVIARIRALFNKEAPNQQATDVNDIIRHVVALLHSMIERQGVVLHTALAPALPPVSADPVQLRQVIVNLVTNAVEAMSGTAGRPRLLAVRSELDRDGAVAVTVEDSGSGFDPDQVTNIFDGFYTTKPGGIGVGLAISRSIIEAHGGSMWAEPGTPYGARFGFTVPLAPADAG